MGHSETLTELQKYNNLEWLHSQVQELQNGNFKAVDLDGMLSVIEALRDDHFKPNGALKHEYRNANA